ncbi:hypothetical protein CHUAL_008791 [Chamberlinius hualienensis]
MATIPSTQLSVSLREKNQQQDQQCTALDLRKTKIKTKDNDYTNSVSSSSEQFYFSNMLRKMVVPRENTNSSAIWQSAIKSNFHCVSAKLPNWPLIGGWPVVNQSSTSASLITHPLCKQLRFENQWKWRLPNKTENKVSSPVNVTKFRPMIKRDHGLSAKSSGRFKMRQTTAFRTPSVAEVVPKCIQPKSAVVNVSYVMKNMNNIFKLTKHRSNPNLETNVSKPTNDSIDNHLLEISKDEKPPCKRFSALIGLEIVVDYVKHNHDRHLAESK